MAENKVTQGKWKARRESPMEITQEIVCGDFCIANVWPGTVDRRPEECLANSKLIVAAVNACKSINPDNPQAVAERIEAMANYLHKAHAWLNLDKHVTAIQLSNEIDAVLDAIERK